MSVYKIILFLIILTSISFGQILSIDFEDGDLSDINFNTPTTGYTYDIVYNHPDSSYYSPANGDSVLKITFTSGNYYNGYLTLSDLDTVYLRYDMMMADDWDIYHQKHTDWQVGGNNSGRVYGPQFYGSGTQSLTRVVWRDDDMEHDYYNDADNDYRVGAGFESEGFTGYPSGASDGWGRIAIFRIAESVDDADDGRIDFWINDSLEYSFTDTCSGSQGVDQIWLGYRNQATTQTMTYYMDNIYVDNQIPSEETGSVIALDGYEMDTTFTTTGWFDGGDMAQFDVNTRPLGYENTQGDSVLTHTFYINDIAAYRSMQFGDATLGTPHATMSGDTLDTCYFEFAISYDDYDWSRINNKMCIVFSEDGGTYASPNTRMSHYIMFLVDHVSADTGILRIEGNNKINETSEFYDIDPNWNGWNVTTNPIYIVNDSLYQFRFKLAYNDSNNANGHFVCWMGADTIAYHTSVRFRYFQVGGTGYGCDGDHGWNGFMLSHYVNNAAIQQMDVNWWWLKISDSFIEYDAPVRIPFASPGVMRPGIGRASPGVGRIH